MHFKRITSLVATFCLVLILSSAGDIVRRHDREDRLYTSFGEEFRAVGKVGLRGGDGTLVGKSWVLTAAHVARGMYRRTNGDFKVYFDNEQAVYTARNIYIYPGAGQGPGHDIALIELSEEVKDIEPFSVNQSDNETGKAIVIVGHGDFKDGTETEWQTDGKRRAATNVIDEVNDRSIIFDFDLPDSPEATHLEGTAGRGDSGGPALIKDGDSYVVAGVSSAGEPGANGPGTYGAREHYVRASTHYRWVKDVMEQRLDPTNMSAGERRVVRGGGGQGPAGLFEGLGLLLRENKGRIEINGKMDMKVPKSIRNISFRPPSFIVKFNNETVESIDDLRQKFDAKSGEYTITFEIQGKVRQYSVSEQ